MRKLLLAAAVLLLMLPVSAMANTITLGSNTTAVTITYVGSNDFTVSIPSSWSGPTIPTGTFDFTGVGLLTFGGVLPVSAGEPFISGTGGTLYLSATGGTYPITWTLLDGDGGPIDLDFTFPGSSGLDSFALNSPAGELETLYNLGIGASWSGGMSSGEVAVPEPATASLAGLGMLGLLGLVGLRWKHA